MLACLLRHRTRPRSAALSGKSHEINWNHMGCSRYSRSRRRRMEAIGEARRLTSMIVSRAKFKKWEKKEPSESSKVPRKQSSRLTIMVSTTMSHARGRLSLRRCRSVMYSHRRPRHPSCHWPGGSQNCPNATFLKSSRLDMKNASST